MNHRIRRVLVVAVASVALFGAPAAAVAEPPADQHAITAQQDDRDDNRDDNQDDGSDHGLWGLLGLLGLVGLVGLVRRGRRDDQLAGPAADARPERTAAPEQQVAIPVVPVHQQAPIRPQAGPEVGGTRPDQV